MTEMVVLTGGVGGAKLVRGLVELDAPPSVTAIVNTGDDFTHLGLHVSPDLDTLLYTLAGKANSVEGWGRADETWNFMEALKSLGGEDWFRLGDGDLALHVIRTWRLARGDQLSAIEADFATAWDIGVRLLPMSDHAVRTWVATDEGELEFQRYFVERRCAPRVSAVSYRGAETAAAAPGVVEAIANAEAVLIAPSNPYLSVGPLLAIPGIAAALRQTTAPVVVVSPLIGGQAVKGPTAKIMLELELTPSNQEIARFYREIADGMVIDQADEAPIDLEIARTHTLMVTADDRRRVARAALDLARSLRP